MKQIFLLTIIILTAATSHAQWKEVTAKPVTVCTEYNSFKVRAVAFIGDSVKVVKRMVCSNSGSTIDSAKTIALDNYFNLINSEATEQKRTAAIKSINLQKK